MKGVEMLENYPEITHLRDCIGRKFPYFVGIFERQYLKFGSVWASAFDKELRLFFGSDKERINTAALGYGAFCLDSMKLQVEFNKTLEYRHKSYEEAASEVYQNEEYMFGLYLPGILISHYLWEHHYIQLNYFQKTLISKIRKIDDPLIYDVGPGTGFYSKEYLRCLEKSRVVGFDMSPHSLKHTEIMVDLWGYADRYESRLGDILLNPQIEKCDVINSIEVLEHLENPIEFLCGLYSMLKQGGLGFISAAVNAPNADHIYLYREATDVAKQIEEAGFRILGQTVDQAYEPRKEKDLVPVNAAFIVTK